MFLLKKNDNKKQNKNHGIDGMQKLKNKLVCGLWLVMAISSVHAENVEESSVFKGFSTSGTVSFLTDYYSRGYSQTEGDPAIQGTLRIDHDSGLYGLCCTNRRKVELF